MKKILVFILSFSCLQVIAQNSSADEYFQQAENCFKAGNYDQALKCLDAFVRVFDNDDVSDAIARAMALKKKINECQDIYSKADSCFNVKKYSEALSQYEKLRQSNPTHPKLDNWIANCRTAIADSKKEQNKPIHSDQFVNQPKSSKALEPETFTMEVELIAGTNVCALINFTVSYFLFGFGGGVLYIAPERTKTSNLINSGYVGEFSKMTTTTLGNFPPHVFLNFGGYFKYFSVSCQVGLLCGAIVERNTSYDGYGYGLVDGDINEYWGAYRYYCSEISTSNKELHLTLTPQIKGYIPLKKNRIAENGGSITLGLGYTFIPTLGYCAGLSGSIGYHFRF